MSNGVLPSRLVIGGDSAGGNLALLSLLYIRDQKPETPLPSAVILHSPMVDFTSKETQYSPRAKTDFLVWHSDVAVPMNDMIRPEGLPFDTPEISALLWKNISKLPPQLIFWSTTEQLASDSERWIERSRKAGTEVIEHKVTGELHTYSLGWPFVGQALQKECDGFVVDFILSHV
jgi:acetyl esterase/lipase